MKEGIVKFFDETKSYGFITDAETNKDVFVHSSGLVDKIQDGDRVQFTTEQGKKGINATNVSLIK